MMQFMAKLVGKTRELALDVRCFGWMVLGRYANQKSSINWPQEYDGPIYFRPHNSDFETLRKALRDKEYDTSFVPEVDDRISDRYGEICQAGKTPIIIDAGANIGAASIWYHAKFPRAKIAAIEPDPNNAAVLRKNVGQHANITVLEAAVGSVPGTVSVIQAPLGWASQTVRSESGLPVVTIAQACQESSGDTLFIVKVDIEGFEADLFSENLDWLDDAFVVAIEPHDWLLPGKRTSGNMQKAIAQHPFEMFHHGENIIYVRL